VSVGQAAGRRRIHRVDPDAELGRLWSKTLVGYEMAVEQPRSDNERALQDLRVHGG
jgi:hypothetical protein